jgi:YVTN family beta-propeller protein
MSSMRRRRAGTTVSVIDTATLQVAHTIEVRNGPQGVVVTPDGSRIFVTNRFGDSVSEIDAATRRVVRTYAVGAEPTGITYTP